MKILLVGDEAKTRRLVSFGLAEEGDQISTVTSAAELTRLPELRTFEVALLDWEMRTEPASELLAGLRRLAPCLPTVVATTTEDRGMAARAAGAADALIKPIEMDATRESLRHYAHAFAEAGAATAEATPPDSAQSDTGAVVDGETIPAAPSAFSLRTPLRALASSEEEDVYDTHSQAVRSMLSIAYRVAPTPASVLILGENGTGKTRLAHMIHRRSPRRPSPFVTVNCPCLQLQLLESELFGHVRGAFTGAVSDATGKVAAAEGGTLFLDEVGELPSSVQPKLLRLLQDRCYERVGEAKTRPANIRVIAATNRDLKAEVAAGRFREDLYYRLNVITLTVPALRHRPEDIVPTAEHFLHLQARTLERSPRGFTLLAREALQSQPWPGNLRELRNTIERVAILCDKELIDASDLMELGGLRRTDVVPQVGEFVTLAALEEAHIQLVIARAENYGHAARVLGIDKATLYRHRKRAENRVAPFETGLGTAAAG